MKRYHLQNLDCAGCAAKIENTLKKKEYVRSVSIDFSSSSMLIDTDFIDKAEKVINKFDPEIIMTEHIKASNVIHAEKIEFEPIKQLWITGICVVLYVLALIFNRQLENTPYSIAAWITFSGLWFFSGRRVLQKAFNNIRQGGLFDENFLMTIATIGAFAIHALSEAAGVMIFFRIGEYLQELSVHRSRKSIKSLLDIRPDYANLIHGSQTIRVSPDEVVINSVIIVKPGEKIPLDGIVIKGASQVDTSALTGESVPKMIHEGDNVLAGMINKSGLLSVRVTKLFIESSVNKILELVENATHKKAKTEMFFSVFARYYTPVIVGIAVLTALIPPLFVADQSFTDWVYRALVILVISCPCALVVSIPLTYFGGIGCAAKRGILIKGSSLLDSLNQVSGIVFDKTGTLTKGVFKVTKISAQNHLTESELLEITAEVEVHSNHPIAQSIKEAYGKEIDYEIVKEYHEIGGQGISAVIRDQQVLIGNARLMYEYKISFAETNESGTIVYVAMNGIYSGYLIISDELKADSPAAVQQLKKAGIKHISMLTGDNHSIAQSISDKLGLTDFKADLLPEDKVNYLEEMIKQNDSNQKIIFVGDGINDAPVLALADIGISMGNLGSDAAIETADIVLMNDSLTKIPELLSISKKNKSIIIQNICIALGIKLLFVILGFFGVASMWEAVFADVGVTLIAVFNASRILKYK